jgi:hypothetical protein
MPKVTPKMIAHETNFCGPVCVVIARPIAAMNAMIQPPNKR